MSSGAGEAEDRTTVLAEGSLDDIFEAEPLVEAVGGPVLFEGSTRMAVTDGSAKARSMASSIICVP